MADLFREKRTLRAAVGAVSLLLAASCGGETKPQTLLDAAGVYAANEVVFESIRGAYPGPYADFNRIPARDPAAETPEGKSFIKALRKNIPVDYVDFFPIGDTGGDELDVVLNRYNEGDKWMTVSVIYFSSPLTLSDEYPNMRLFEHCDGRALDWISGRHMSGPYAVFCRLNESWYAYQRVD